MTRMLRKNGASPSTGRRTTTVRLLLKKELPALVWQALERVLTKKSPRTQGGRAGFGALWLLQAARRAALLATARAVMLSTRRTVAAGVRM